MFFQLLVTKQKMTGASHFLISLCLTFFLMGERMIKRRDHVGESTRVLVQRVPTFKILRRGCRVPLWRVSMMSYVCFSLGELQLRAPRWRDSPSLPSRQQAPAGSPLQQLLCVSRAHLYSRQGVTAQSKRLWCTSETL